MNLNKIEIQTLLEITSRVFCFYAIMGVTVVPKGVAPQLHKLWAISLVGKAHVLHT